MFPSFLFPKAASTQARVAEHNILYGPPTSSWSHVVHFYTEEKKNSETHFMPVVIFLPSVPGFSCSLISLGQRHWGC